MHPAFSVIFFTTASGAGYGLLALLGVLAALGILPDNRLFGFVAMALSIGLITAGLLSSTLHLGHPERAWRAFTQWRSSWLSREGVFSILTYVPAAFLGIAWVLFGKIDGWVAIAGLLATLGAIVTVSTTAMIYASLKPIAQWSSHYTLPAYLLFAAMTGALLLNALLLPFGYELPAIGILAAMLVAVAWAWKIATWLHNATLSLPAKASATGLSGGEVRIVEWPHTEENYLLKEMGYRVARKHAESLRVIVHVFAFALPLILSSLTVLLSGWVPALLAVLAVLSAIPGMLSERWLFFAEAKHTVSLYYR